MGSGCGAVGRTVASDTGGPGFESNHWQLLFNIYLLLTVCRKDKKIKKKRPGWPILKSVLTRYTINLSSSIPALLTPDEKTSRQHVTRWSFLRTIKNSFVRFKN